MKHNLGFRAMLDAEQAAFDKLMAQVPCPDFIRAGTWSICETCGKAYVEHPYLIPHYVLHKLCDGRIVKT